ncbi:hypothetical protein J5X84_38650 [Streptosporangiaceae bacterium NEAU-GS5]|nr:hypothetical protein [Streptosporangiaceae bacterium NEAU-GS5]
MTVKRWIAAAGLAAAMTGGALAVTATPASASPLSNVRDGCLNSGGGWYEFDPYDEPRYRYACLNFYPTGWMIFFYRSNGMNIGFNSGTGPVNFNPNNVQRP